MKRFFLLMGIVVISILEIACATAKPIVIKEYVEVYKPQPCNLPYPVLAAQTGDVVEDQLSIEQYIYELTATLTACKGGKYEELNLRKKNDKPI